MIRKINLGAPGMWSINRLIGYIKLIFGKQQKSYWFFTFTMISYHIKKKLKRNKNQGHKTLFYSMSDRFLSGCLQLNVRKVLATANNKMTKIQNMVCVFTAAIQPWMIIVIHEYCYSWLSILSRLYI